MSAIAPPAAEVRFAQIEPVGQCNLRCQMCPIQFRKDGPPHGPPALMDFDVYRRLLDQLPGLRELHLQGLGEPLMHPRFVDMVNLAARRGVQVSTNSNLTLLTPARAERLVTSGLAEISVSLDGAAAATFERIRVKARFARVLRNLGHLMRARTAHPGALARVRLVTVLMRQNLHELPDIVRLAHRYGVTSLFVQHLCHDFGETSLPGHYRPMRRFVDEQTLLGAPLADIEVHFRRARETAACLGVDLRLPRPRPRAFPDGDGRTAGTRGGCDWPSRGPYISYDGKAMPCCMVATPDRIHFGDVTAQGIAPVWEGQGYRQFREALASDAPPEVCRSCALYHGMF